MPATLVGIVRLAAIGLLAAAALVGCGSVAEMPPPGGPAASPPLSDRPAGRVVERGGDLAAPPRTGPVPVDGGRAVARLDPAARVLEVHDRTGRRIARAHAGVGPTHVVAGPGSLIYVVDTTGDGLLVFELRPRLRLTRRLPVLGRPYAIAADRAGGRLWVTTTATNRLVELADGARPHRLRDFPAVRQPDAVAVDPVAGRVSVAGRADGVVQLLDLRPRSR